MTIREKIIEHLKVEGIQTIQQISEGIGVKEELIRNKIFAKEIGMIPKGEVVKVAYKQRKGFFALTKDHIDLKELKAEIKHLVSKCIFH